MSAMRTFFGRRSSVELVVILALAGAALGALAGADPRPPAETAQVTIALDPSWPTLAGDPALVRARLDDVARAARDPQVLEAAAHITATTRASAAASTQVVRDDRRAVLNVSARAATVEGAQALAAALADQMVAEAQRSLNSTGRVEVLGDFEYSVGGWSGLPSSLPFPPSILTTRRGSASEGTGYLTVSCRPTPGCGVTVPIKRYIEKGETLRVTARMRAAADRTTAGMVLGVAGSDVVELPRRRVSERWRPVSLTWRSSVRTGAATLAIEVDGGRRPRLDLDDVTIAWSRPAPSPGDVGARRRRAERQAIEQSQYAGIAPAQATGRVGGAPVTESALGAGTGGIVAICGLVAAGAARRRRSVEADGPPDR